MSERWQASQPVQDGPEWKICISNSIYTWGYVWGSSRHEAENRGREVLEWLNNELPFTKDVSKENPKLHQLYVRYAQEELLIYQELLDRLRELSRVNPSIMAGLISQERSKLIKSDAAYKEAAWRVLANDFLEPERKIVPNHVDHKGPHDASCYGDYDN